MDRKSYTIRVRIANPAGNITAFVLDPVAREDYAAVANQILDVKEWQAEQVAYVTGPDSMEMCGLEFCGNASRAFALMRAEALAVQGREDMVVNVSGTDGPLTVTVVPEIRYARLAMPLHRRVERDVLGGRLVDLGGIIHLVLEGVPASRETFDALKDEMIRRYNPPALGVMFCEGTKMTPVVYVRDVDTTYFEGSCGSGTTAYAIAHTFGKPDGRYTYEIRQPAGTIVAVVHVTDGVIGKVTIEGEVELGPVETMTVEVPVEAADTEAGSSDAAGASDQEPAEAVKDHASEEETGGEHFPTIDEFEEIVADVLDELPEGMFKDLSGGVVVDPKVMISDYARHNELYTMGTYNVSRLGRQIRIYYGSFEQSFHYMRGEQLKAEVRRIVRHEFRHHLEFLGGVRGKDSLEEEDHQQKIRYLKGK